MKDSEVKPKEYKKQRTGGRERKMKKQNKGRGKVKEGEEEAKD